MTNLTQKLAIPLCHPQAVQRTHLLERLSAGIDRGYRLTLLAAPAGAGKSALAAAWARATDRPFAWLTLDARDNDPACFFADLRAALVHAVGSRPLTGSPPVANLPALPKLPAPMWPLVLVLDNLERIAQPAVYALIAQLVEAMPSAMHLVLSTRTDPPLPLARMRADALLAELRAPDLRFTSAEIAAWFASMHGVALTPAQIVAIEQRTEGWAAGLQLAAYALRECPDIGECIRRFDGSHYVVAEYLSSEVFAGLPADLRTFLGQVAILGKLSAPLCMAVTANPASAELLARLVHANLFLTPLDSSHTWFRFHPLFAEAACAVLAQPGQAARQRRAAVWYAEHGFPAEAVAHALAADAPALAAGLLAVAPLGRTAGLELLATGPANPLAEQSAVSSWQPPATLPAADRRLPTADWIEPSLNGTSTGVAALIEPISAREQEVLELLAAGLTYAEIAARLVVSLNTVRSHVKHLYGKLGAHVRMQAISRAHELQLLG